MIPFLPELPATPAPAAALPTQAGGGGMPGGGVGNGAGEGRPPLDFAGLLDAALPGANVALPLAEASAAGAAPAEAPPVMRPLASLSPGLKLARDGRLPGTILPDAGTDLPLPAAHDAPPPPMLAPVPDTAPVVVPVAVPLSASGPATDAVIAEPSEPEDAPAPEAALLALLPALPAAPAPAPVPTRVGGSGDPARAPLPAAPMPGPAQGRSALRSLPVLPSEPAREDVPESAAPAPLSAETPETARQPAATAAAPLAPPPAAPVLAQPAQPLAPAPLAAGAEPRSPAPSQESAIAQVGEIREALRSVRPEMTLRHAEFGVVSLRLEGTSAAPQDWRALLASRDPGFVPAIQAALADRAVAASADTASTGTGTGTGAQAGGHTGAGSSSEQRYGFSQGGGQGSSSPYPGHSGPRDEGASPHQRNPQQGRADDSAATAAAAPDSEATDQRPRGLFA